MSRHNLPKAGSRARRVLDALFSSPTSPVEERALMARHYLSGNRASTWVKEVYHPLQDAFLIVCHEGSNGVVHWALTDKGSRLMRAEQAAVLVPDITPEQAASRMAQPRTAPVFRPMALGSRAIRATRDGSLDYQTIPSMMGGKRCA